MAMRLSRKRGHSRFGPPHGAMSPRAVGGVTAIPILALDKVWRNRHIPSMPSSPKPVKWVGSSRKDLSGFPLDVRQVMGFALYMAQTGEKHLAAKPLKGLVALGSLKLSRITMGIHFAPCTR